MSRIIYAPSNGPACSMEDLVAQYIDWSPTIYNDVSEGFYMAPEQMQYCPTKAQIKNSATMSVTLYKQAIYQDSSIVQFKKGTTYKFNGEVGQFPRLYVLDMYPDYKPTKQYSSKELVKLCDVSAFYNHHDITFRLNNFALKDGVNPIVSSNLVLDEDNKQIITDSGIYPYDMKEETYFSWSLPTIDSVANWEQYKQDKFTYNVIGYEKLAGPYTLGQTVDVTDVERDVTIDVYGEKKDLINIYISTDGRVKVVNYIEEFSLSNPSTLEEKTIIDPPNTYSTYKTDYPSDKYDRFKFLIRPENEDDAETYTYEFKKNGSLVAASSSVGVPFSTYIYQSGLKYRESDDAVINSYTLWVGIKEKYKGNNIRIIINNEVADSMDVWVSETAGGSYEQLSPSTSSTKMEFSYVIQTERSQEEQKKLYIKVVGDASKLKNYDLINGIYATNNKSYKIDASFGGGTDTAYLNWEGGTGRNTIIYIRINRIELMSVAIKKLGDVSVYDNYSKSVVVFNNESASISTVKDYPNAVSLKIQNLSASSNIVNYKWYIKSKMEESVDWALNVNDSSNFVKSGLLSGKNYRLELRTGIAYNSKIVTVVINNSDPNIHISVASGSWSADGSSYNTITTSESLNGGKTVKFTMNQGYYFKTVIVIEESYHYSTCNYRCVFKGKNGGQMGSEIIGSETVPTSNQITIIIPNIPAECTSVEISTSYSKIKTYKFEVRSLPGITVYNYAFTSASGAGSWNRICQGSPNEIGYIIEQNIQTSNANPNAFKLRFSSQSPDDNPAMKYMLIDTTTPTGSVTIESNDNFNIDDRGGYCIYNSPTNLFEEHDGGVVFQVMELINNGRTIFIYTTLSNVNIIVKDRHNGNNVIVDFSNNAGSDFKRFVTGSGNYNNVSWSIDMPTGYGSCDIELYGSNDSAASSPSFGTWTKVGDSSTGYSGGNFDYIWGQDLEGNSATEYNRYYVKLSNFMEASTNLYGSKVGNTLDGKMPTMRGAIWYVWVTDTRISSLDIADVSVNNITGHGSRYNEFVFVESVEQNPSGLTINSVLYEIKLRNLKDFVHYGTTNNHQTRYDYLDGDDNIIYEGYQLTNGITVKNGLTTVGYNIICGVNRETLFKSPTFGDYIRNYTLGMPNNATSGSETVDVEFNTMTSSGVDYLTNATSVNIVPSGNYNLTQTATEGQYSVTFSSTTDNLEHIDFVKDNRSDSLKITQNPDHFFKIDGVIYYTITQTSEGGGVVPGGGGTYYESTLITTTDYYLVITGYNPSNYSLSFVNPFNSERLYDLGEIIKFGTRKVKTGGTTSNNYNEIINNVKFYMYNPLTYEDVENVLSSDESRSLFTSLTQSGNNVLNFGRDKLFSVNITNKGDQSFYDFGVYEIPYGIYVYRTVSSTSSENMQHNHLNYSYKIVQDYTDNIPDGNIQFKCNRTFVDVTTDSITEYRNETYGSPDKNVTDVRWNDGTYQLTLPGVAEFISNINYEDVETFDEFVYVSVPSGHKLYKLVFHIKKEIEAELPDEPDMVEWIITSTGDGRTTGIATGTSVWTYDNAYTADMTLMLNYSITNPTNYAFIERDGNRIIFNGNNSYIVYDRINNSSNKAAVGILTINNQNISYRQTNTTDVLEHSPSFNNDPTDDENRGITVTGTLNNDNNTPCSMTFYLSTITSGTINVYLHIYGIAEPNNVYVNIGTRLNGNDIFQETVDSNDYSLYYTESLLTYFGSFDGTIYVKAGFIYSGGANSMQMSSQTFNKSILESNNYTLTITMNMTSTTITMT